MIQNKHTPGPVESCDTCKNNGGTRGECQNESCAYEPKTKPVDVELATLRKQRDELLSALEKCRKELSAWMRDHGDDIATQEAVADARSAIASVKGEQ